LVHYPKEYGALGLSGYFIDGTFVGAKKGTDQWDRPNGERVRSSWSSQTLLVLTSASGHEVTLVEATLAANCAGE